MKSRVAGILSDNPHSVHSYARLAEAHFASRTSSIPRIFLIPEEQPVLGVVISEGCIPPVLWWRDGDGSLVVLDGEIHNARDLRIHAGSAHQETSDAQLVYGCYRRGGVAALSRIDASAGIVIWDAAQRELLILRDSEGAVPVFHAAWNGAVIFSSETTMLLRAGIPRTIDIRTLDFFLTKGYAPAPWTFVKGIQKLTPGHLLSCRIGRTPILSCYARRVTQPKHSFSLRQRNEQIGDLLAGSLRRRYDPGVSTAVLLSGGVDSALVLACLVKLIGAKVDAFTFRYGDYCGPLNEENPAGEVARHLGVRHGTIVCRPSDIAADLQQAVLDYGEPLAWGLHSFMLGHLRQSGIRTILTGIGPDTWNVLKLDLVAMRFRILPAPVRALVRAGLIVARQVFPRLTNPVTAILRTERNGLPPQFIYPNIMNDDLRQAIYAQRRWFDTGREASSQLLVSILDQMHDEDAYDQSRLFDHRLFDAEGVLYWNTAWGRSAGLVMRHPYYDRELQEFFFRFSGAVPGKRYLREFAATVLPPGIANAPKRHHAIPIGHWFRGPLRDLLLSYLSPTRLRDSGLFSPQVVAQLVDAHLLGRADHGWRLWCLLATVVWQDVVLNASATDESPRISPKPGLST